MNTTHGNTIEKVKEFKVSGDWNAQSKKLKQQFSELTDSDLKLETGKEDDMLARVGLKLNKKREEVIGLIKKGQLEKTTSKF